MQLRIEILDLAKADLRAGFWFYEARAPGLVSSNLIFFGFYTEGTEKGTQRPQSRKGAF